MANQLTPARIAELRSLLHRTLVGNPFNRAVAEQDFMIAVRPHYAELLDAAESLAQLRPICADEKDEVIRP
jgi:hypothetical protein